MGRRKIEMKRINNKDRRKVTCTKRQHGLFRKAAELCNMCGAGIAILTVSLGGKFNNFGHLDVDSIIARYCGDEGSFTVDENHDCVSQEDDEEVSSDEVDEPERRLEVSSDVVDEQEGESEVSSDEVDAGGEEELVNNIEEKDLTNPIDDETDGSREFWWDKEEPVDPDQVRMYYQSLTELRNNVAWMLNDRNTRESFAKDYVSMI